MDQARLAPLGDDQVARLGAGVLHMGAGGVEVGVVQHHVARLGDGGEEDVLGRAALVGGDHVLEAGDVLDGGLELVEGGGAGIGLVAGDHACPLAGGHGARAAVGEQVDEHVAGAEQKGVVAGCRQLGFALSHSRELDGFHGADAEGFDDGLWVEGLHLG